MSISMSASTISAISGSSTLSVSWVDCLLYLYLIHVFFGLFAIFVLCLYHLWLVCCVYALFAPTMTCLLCLCLIRVFCGLSTISLYAWIICLVYIRPCLYLGWLLHLYLFYFALSVFSMAHTIYICYACTLFVSFVACLYCPLCLCLLCLCFVRIFWILSIKFVPGSSFLLCQRC